MGYGEWLHGEAVAAGTMMAAELSRQLGWIDAADVDRIEGLFRRASWPVRGPNLNVDTYLDLMQHDKKVQGGKLRLILLKKIGQAAVSNVAAQAEIARAIVARSADE
jgi:3-dehydroquinate synthase